MVNSFYKKKDEEDRYRLSSGKLGAPLTIQNANQIQDMAKRLNEGVKNIEISAISPEIAEGIPREHFVEMRRLGELTGVKVSVHAPIIDASGFSDKEGRWSEQNRINVEGEFGSIIEKANLVDKNGNVPIVIHGANTFGQDWNRATEEKYLKEIERKKKEILSDQYITKEIKEREIEFLENKKKEPMPRVLAIVNEETGQVQAMEYEEKERFAGKEVWDPYRRLLNVNESEWDKQKLEVLSRLKEYRELEQHTNNISKNYEILLSAKDYLLDKEDKREKQMIKAKLETIKGHMVQLDSHIGSALEDFHDRLIKFKNEDPKIDYFLKSDEYNQVKNSVIDIEKRQKELGNTIKFSKINEADREKLGEKYKEYSKIKNERITQLMAEMPAPKLWKPVNDFAIKKASETFANVAFKAYNDFKEKAPIIAIENSYPNMPISRAKEMKETINLAREKLVKRLVEEKNIKQDEAESIAKKIIGATWDVGHINMLRKAGYSPEEILEEVKKIAPEVKHLHLTDNFGFNDTHLPPGMGNVSIKETLKILEERGDFENMRAIVESGNFVGNFKTSPYPYTLENLGSPLYRMGGDSYWNEFEEKHLTRAGEYSMGYGDILPDLHFKKLYGGGFSGLPKELGGGGDTSDRGRFASGE